MNKEFIIEMVGYLGSLLVLVSFLMTSVVKLRIVNSVGSLIFMIYALIIKSYPTAVMNGALVIINLRFLLKSRNTEQVFELVKVNNEDALLQFLLKYYQSDILTCFPTVDLDLSNSTDIYVVTCNGKPVGITAGKRTGDDLYLLLDYSIPEYRDFSVAEYLNRHIKEEGVKRLIYSGSTENHLDYLNKLGYKQVDGQYILDL